MSTGMSFAIVCAVLTVSGPAAYWQIRRAQNAELERDRIARAATSAVRDTQPGINLADQDACELLWSMPEFDRAAAQLSEGLTGLFEQLGPPPTTEQEEER